MRALLGIAPDPDIDALLTLAPQLTALFRLPMPTAPRGVMIGAQVPCADAVLSATGVGETPRAALAACLGEAAEILALAPRAGGPPPRLSARRLPDGAAVAAPADACLRANTALVPAPGAGVAAGRDIAAARRAAFFELVERDALARWRDAGAALAPAAAEAAQATCARLGRPATAPTMTLALLPALAPVALATSATGWGCAADATQADAARRAVLELCAAETGAALDAARGRPSPNPPHATPTAPPRETARADAEALIAALAARGAAVIEVDLSRPDLPTPVVRLFCAALGARAPWWRAG